MSNGAYAALSNSTEKVDVTIPIKESVPAAMSSHSNDETLKHRYIQIAIAVALYW